MMSAVTFFEKCDDRPICPQTLFVGRVEACNRELTTNDQLSVEDSKGLQKNNLNK